MYKGLLTTVSAIALMVAGSAIAAEKIEKNTDAKAGVKAESQMKSGATGSADTKADTDAAAGSSSSTGSAKTAGDADTKADAEVGADGTGTNAAAGSSSGTGSATTAGDSDATGTGAGMNADSGSSSYKSYSADSESLKSKLTGNITADAMMDADIVNSNGDTVADVNDLLINQNGEVEKVLVDVGGFLGLGSRTVALDLADLEPEQGSGTDTTFVTSMSKEQLEALPRYVKQDDQWMPAPEGDAAAGAGTGASTSMGGTSGGTSGGATTGTSN